MGASSSSPSFVSAAHPIEGGLKDGHVITIKGTFLKSEETRFAVNFHVGLSHDKIAFHFNPRFEEGGYVVCNTKQKGLWEQEERNMRNPFLKEKPFEICFLVKRTHFEVLVDGDHFVGYEHRVPFHRGNHISVTGPVEQRDISFQFIDEIPLVKCCQTPCNPPEPKEQKAKPRNYCQTTKATITQTVIHTVQSTPGQMFPGSLQAPSAHNPLPPAESCNAPHDVTQPQ